MPTYNPNNQGVTATATIGDVKPGLQAASHGGWILLAGQLVITLTPTQQAAWATLGIAGTNLPNPPTGSAILKGTIGQIVGSSTITQANLPNVSLAVAPNGAGTPSGTVSTTVNAQYHSATGGGFNGGRIQLTDRNPSFNQLNPSEMTVSASFTGNALPAHGHTVPLGGLGAAYTPLGLGTNIFLYLGA